MQQELFALSPPHPPVRIDEPDPSGYLPIYRVQPELPTSLRESRFLMAYSHPY
jgi:hypothetical protein